MGTWDCYSLIEAYDISGNFEAAIDLLSRKLSIRHKFGTYAAIYPRTSLFYPLGIYSLGRLYEKMEDFEQALNYYEKFLDIWRNPDMDLPEYAYANNRVIQLRAEKLQNRSLSGMESIIEEGNSDPSIVF
jgi:tetratricopeptide (TPR) repeat protein